VGPGKQAGGAEHRGVEGPVKSGEEGSVTIGRRLLETLLDHKAASAFADDDDLVFPTSRGRHDNPSNIRTRVLRPAIERANQRLARAKRALIPTGATPHSLRHT
jgi:integrase